MTLKDVPVNYSETEEVSAKIEFTEGVIELEVKSPMMGTYLLSGQNVTGVVNG